MYQQAPDLEQRLSKLQAQLDRLSLTLLQLQQSQDHVQPMEVRLSHLIQESGAILDRLTTTDQHHAQLVAAAESRMNEWSATESRLQHDAYQRMTELRQTIEQEWGALRQQLTSELQSAIADLRTEAHRTRSLPAAPTPEWPLEGVLRLHEELRQSPDEPNRLPAPKEELAEPQLPEAAASLAGRVDSLERALSFEKEELTLAVDRTERGRRSAYIAFGLIALLVVSVGAIALGLVQRQLDARMNEAAARVAAAEQQAQAATAAAGQRVAATREDADRQIAEARQTAQKAQIVSDVLAAPDLIRFNLTSPSAPPRPYGQLLWSRSRGLVFSGSRVPAPSSGNTYQLWLMTTAEPVSAGLLMPDSAGRVTLVTDSPPKVPRPVTGASVTVEPAGGRATPSGPSLMERGAIRSESEAR
jgi:Tfp pilus assembly protein PilV